MVMDISMIPLTCNIAVTKSHREASLFVLLNLFILEIKWHYISSIFFIDLWLVSLCILIFILII